MQQEQALPNPALPNGVARRALNKSSLRPTARERLSSTVANKREAVAEALRAGKTPAEIASMLGINTVFASRIATEAAVALPSLPKAEGTRDWTESDDRNLMDGRDRRGITWSTLCTQLDRARDEIQLRHAYLTRLAARRTRQGANQVMQCMTCRRDFVSVNRVTNRRCDPCNNSTDGLPEGFMCLPGSESGRYPHAD